jgi:hypothetical protein
MDIFVPIRFRTSIQLSPADLVVNFEDVILDKVRSSLEGVCSRYGFIKPGSIGIVKRSVGSFVKQHFNGHIKFELVCRAEVCNPNVGAVFEAVVKNKNALGVHAESVIQDETVLDIIIPKRSVGIVSNINLEELEVGDKIFVEVLGKRYQLNDKKISIIGRAIKEPHVPAAASTSTNSDENEEVDIAIDEGIAIDEDDEYDDEAEGTEEEGDNDDEESSDKEEDVRGGSDIEEEQEQEEEEEFEIEDVNSEDSSVNSDEDEAVGGGYDDEY